MSIVNRRNSDLVDKSDGVLYTSDGRDVEMAVPSTKAFYAQIAAGFLLAVALADEVDDAGRRARCTSCSTPCGRCPDAMRRVLGQRDAIAEIARRHATTRRYWAVVGNGRNRIAAAEVRIKASELCYKSISFDATEDKKHIDLSAEPLVLVCAAGLQGSNADDVAKEIAIYRAHQAAPIVIANDGERRFDAALETIPVPVVHADVGVRALGHGRPPLRVRGRARDRRVGATAARGARRDPGRGLGQRRRPRRPRPPSTRRSRARRRPSSTALRAGGYDGHLEAGTAVRIASLLRYAIGIVPLDVYQVEHGAVGTPSRVVEDLTAALTAGIEELTRPVDAIKHQAKTVTVGISRSDEELLQVALVARGAGGRRGARRAQLPRAAHAGRARPCGRAGRRLHPLPHRG